VTTNGSEVNAVRADLGSVVGVAAPAFEVEVRVGGDPAVGAALLEAVLGGGGGGAVGVVGGGVRDVDGGGERRCAQR